MKMNESDSNNNRYWMSLEQWRQDPEFLAMAEKEFQSSPLQSTDGDGEGGWARREFLKLMGASLALTTFGCVRRPAQKIIPYAKKPAEVVHGIPNYYASSYCDGLEGLGILVTTRDGRPIKIEGNPDHPANAGSMSARGHAHILQLYDPDRFSGPKRNLQNEKRTNRETINVSWENLDKAVVEQLKKGKVGVLMGTNLSPSTQAVVDDFAGAFGAKVYHYDDISYDALRGDNKTGALPSYRFDKAKYIVAINNDFLGTWLTPTVFQRQFGISRKATESMNKLVVFESLMSLTGSNADQRYRIRPSQTLDTVMGILHQIVVVNKQSRFAGDESVMRALSGFGRETGGGDLAKVADELWKNRGQGIVVAGGLTAGTGDAAAIQAATAFLNSVLDNNGKTIIAGASLNRSSLGMGELIPALNSGEIKTLIIHNCNPVYSMPAEAQFSTALSRLELIVYTGDRNDETARMADYVATDHHSLENWGDMQSIDGVLSIQQPTIQPLGETRALQDSFIAWTKGAGKSSRSAAAGTWYDFLRSRWKDSVYPNQKARGASDTFDGFWNGVLQVGALVMPRAEAAPATPATSAVTAIKPASRGAGFELALYSTIGLGDGRLANVSWLQEFPDPVTKICWDNYATVSVKDAKQLGLREGQWVSLTVGANKVDVPAHIQPGQADGVIGLAVGFGRKGGGKIADGVGANAFALAKWSNGERVTAGIPVEVKALSKREKLACTQDHHSMEGRQIVVEETLRDHIKSPGGRVHRHEIKSMWSEHSYKGLKWGMVIDLNSCTGCGSCVIACQSENNIPTVGKRYVKESREMHWLRIDRYYVGDPDDPSVVHQPIVCMHCDNAPCETVCPVAATVHSSEGTNDMIYNRCVGTRYCSNNCPYKVRRFNWFNYTNDIAEPQKMALNPEVTVRFRGVMEKCTFCIHRIQFGKNQAKLQDRTLQDGEVQTACQQSCPSKSITFGDLNNPESAVAKAFNAPQSYALLENLNTKPAVHYQVKVRNVEELKGQPEHHEKGHHA